MMMMIMMMMMHLGETSRGAGGIVIVIVIVDYIAHSHRVPDALKRRLVNNERKKNFKVTFKMFTESS